MNFSTRDKYWMRHALRLAAQGKGLTSPNPCVGAVLVKAGKKIGEGFHLKAGNPHAEVLAVKNARQNGHQIQGTTLYVTLEPCSTYGRTPPCCTMIIREKIKRIVVAATDPNPKHAGQGFKILRKAGCEVVTGILAEEANDLNRDFNHWITTRKPWVVGKIAISLDGKIDVQKGDNPWLTGKEARLKAHELRWNSDAIIIGAETLRIDNPRLTVRLPERKGKLQPWRVVLTRSGQLPLQSHLFTDRYRHRTVVYQKKNLLEVLNDLGKKGVMNVLIEGGGQVLRSALSQNLVNELTFFWAPVVSGGDAVI